MPSFEMYAFLALVITGTIWMYSQSNERQVGFDSIGPATPATPASDGPSVSINIGETTTTESTVQLYPESGNNGIELKSQLSQQVAIEKGTGITRILVDSNNGANQEIMPHREWIEIVSNDEALVAIVAHIMIRVEEDMIRMFGDGEQITGEGMERYTRELRDPRQMEGRETYQERRRYAEMMRNPLMFRIRLEELFFSSFQLNGWFNNVENWRIRRPVEDTNYIANIGMLRSGPINSWMHEVCNAGMSNPDFKNSIMESVEMKRKFKMRYSMVSAGMMTDRMMRDPCRMVLTDSLRDSYELNRIFNDYQISDFFRIRYLL